MLALVPQHGAESHFVRPDGVTRSSILQAIPGFDPVMNAQGVALRFTQPHYFATTVPAADSAMSGLAGLAFAGIPLWQRIRLKIASAVARGRATAVMRRAAMNGTLAGFGSSDVPYEAITSLPNAFGPGKYGLAPANEQMALVAARITAGLPPQEMMPDVAQSQYQAAAAIAPDYANIPAQHAAAVAAYAPPLVAQAAYARGMNFFVRLRQWWFG